MRNRDQVEWDDELEQFAVAAVERQRKDPVPQELQDKFNANPAAQWDQFYAHNKGMSTLSLYGAMYGGLTDFALRRQLLQRASLATERIPRTRTSPQTRRALLPFHVSPRPSYSPSYPDTGWTKTSRRDRLRKRQYTFPSPRIKREPSIPIARLRLLERSRQRR